jgi:hypothetical protein
VPSALLGSSTSEAEITHISKNGVWLLLADEELFMSFDDFPWFKDAPVAKILEVEWPSKDHLYWPSLDVDLSIESVRNPSKFPFKQKP